MNVDIFSTDLLLDLYGFSGTAANKDYAETAFALMGKLWQSVKSNNIKNKGMNIWVYEPDEKVFAGVELDEVPQQASGLERKSIMLVKYAYYKHIGPYSLLKQAGIDMREELRRKGFETTLPYIEMYGHWTKNETKLETELLMCLQ